MKNQHFSVLRMLAFSILTMGCTILISCKTLYSKKELEQASSSANSQYEQRDLLFQYRQQDSFSSYWYVKTDSQLWFHPDSGLWAKGGQFYVKQSGVHLSEEQLRSNQGKGQVTKTSESQTQQEKQTVSLMAFVFPLIVLIGLFYFFLFIYRR